MVHGDIKPDNLLVTSSGSVKIGDFSVSQVFEVTNLSPIIFGTFWPFILFLFQNNNNNNIAYAVSQKYLKYPLCHNESSLFLYSLNILYHIILFHTSIQYQLVIATICSSIYWCHIFLKTCWLTLY